MIQGQSWLHGEFEARLGYIDLLGTRKQESVSGLKNPRDKETTRKNKT